MGKNATISNTGTCLMDELPSKEIKLRPESKVIEKCKSRTIQKKNSRML